VAKGNNGCGRVERVGMDEEKGVKRRGILAGSIAVQRAPASQFCFSHTNLFFSQVLSCSRCEQLCRVLLSLADHLGVGVVHKHSLLDRAF